MTKANEKLGFVVAQSASFKTDKAQALLNDSLIELVSIRSDADTKMKGLVLKLLEPLFADNGKAEGSAFAIEGVLQSVNPKVASERPAIRNYLRRLGFTLSKFEIVQFKAPEGLKELTWEAFKDFADNIPYREETATITKEKEQKSYTGDEALKVFSKKVKSFADRLQGLPPEYPAVLAFVADNYVLVNEFIATYKRETQE